jgi:hypothetical protein
MGRVVDARLLGLWVRIRPKTWMFFFCVCCVLYTQRPRRRADLSNRELLTCACVYVCARAIRRNNNLLHIQRVEEAGLRLKEVTCH